MKRTRGRLALIVCDSLGIGEAPDAASYGDVGSHTLCHIAESGKLAIPEMLRLGLGNIDGVNCLSRGAGNGAIARLRPLSVGKDTITGHWELMGQITSQPFPTYPEGFPEELTRRLIDGWGRGIIGNRPASGTEIIEELGPAHIATGKLIVYTSADSVLQIAAHEDVVNTAELYRYCQIARHICIGQHGVARIIARPFTGSPGGFVRTPRRKDFPLEPPVPLALDALADAGVKICAVGKIGEIYAGRGFCRSEHTTSNADGMKTIDAAWRSGECDMVFANLVDFDMLYGHRNDVSGYAAALNAFDNWLGGFMARMGPEDVVIITADHGCDPSTPSTDHSREYVPLIIAGAGVVQNNFGTLNGFGFAGAAVCGFFKVDTQKQFGDAAGIFRSS